jgi:hypothetical protein
LSASYFLFFIGVGLELAKTSKSLEKSGSHPFGFRQSFPVFALHVTELASLGREEAPREHFVIARSEATKQSRTGPPHWIASLRSQ